MRLLVLLLVFSSGMLSAQTLYEPIVSFSADKAALQRKYQPKESAEHYQRILLLYETQLQSLEGIDFEALNVSDRIDYLCFRNYLLKELDFTGQAYSEFQELEPVTAFALQLYDFIRTRRTGQKPDARRMAEVFHETEMEVQLAQSKLDDNNRHQSWQKARQAANIVESLRISLKDAHNFYFGYDIEYSWWTEKPFEKLYRSLQAYEKTLSEHYAATVVKDDGSGIVGWPIGREALLKSLHYEMIPYTPEELIKLAEKEFAWCETEMLKASRELGYENDWKAALEHVKNQYHDPGIWPERIHELAVEAIDFLETHDLITIPPLAKETWRMTMMSPEQQLQSPFFLGGEAILIAYPTNTMEHDAKMMSLRGNNPHFARAVVHHELIPGHHLQQFMNQRNKPYRALFYTPFWTEGWALYWEFNLYDKGFASTPEDKIGMLFWRMHRCARIIFSLNYHLGNMTPQQCIDLLVDKVGHERANAEAEVRRSFTGRYGPLYQIAYMIGGLQFYQLKKELVESGNMTEKAFHDAIMSQNYLPIELLRAQLHQRKLPKNFQSEWWFYR